MLCRIDEKCISILGTRNRGPAFVAYAKDKGKCLTVDKNNEKPIQEKV